MTFDQLDSLEICIYDRLELDERQNMTNTLIKAIPNAPSLTKLVLINPAVEIADVEDLHAGATNLKHLQFDHGHVYDNDEENQAFYHSTYRLTSFSLTGVANGILGTTVEDWIPYIGSKYPQLRNLCLTMVYKLNAEHKEEIKKSLEIALENMLHLSRLSIDVCSVNQPVFDVIKKNDVQLEHFETVVDNDDSFQETLAIIQNAQEA